MNKTQLGLLVLLAATLLPRAGWGYNLLTSNGSPVRFHGDGNGISNVTWYMDPSTEENSLGAGETQPAMERAFQRWEDVACSSIDFSYGGLAQVGERGWQDDGSTVVTFEDPFNDLGGGVLAATITWDVGTFQQNNGINFRNISNMDVVFGDGINFILADDIQNGCANRYNIEQIALHEFGHGIGYAHSCESGEACPDAKELAAVMYWAAGACDDIRTLPQEDDLAMHTLVYGPNNLTTFSPSNDRGGTPLVVDFMLSTFADATGLSAVWNFGDGETSNELNPSHTYGDEGQYSVRLELSGSSATCGGDFTHEVFEENLVTACNLPETTFTQQVEDLTVTFAGQTTGASGIGCVDELTWDFGDGSPAEHTRNTVHTYEKPGTYTVSFTAEGVAGQGPAFTRDLQLGDEGCKCTMSGTGSRPKTAALLMGLLVAFGAVVFRRRVRKTNTIRE